MLKELAQRVRSQPDLPPMYQLTRFDWFIDLHPDGRLVGFVPTAGADGRSGVEFPAPAFKRTSGIVPVLLADNAEYTLGIGREKSDPQRVQRQFQAYLELVKACARETGDPAVAAVATFLGGWDPQAGLQPPDLKPGSKVTFRVGDELVISRPKVQEFWARHARKLRTEEGTEDTCLVCGQERPPMNRMPFRIQGIPGGQAGGTELVSTNKEAFESFGRRGGLNSPICQECAEKFTNSLNELLANPEHRLYVGQSVYVFWSRGERSFSPVRLLSDPNDDLLAELSADLEATLRREARTGEVGAAMSAVWTGQEREMASDLFFGLLLTANSGRTVVRDWFQTALTEVKHNLARWFAVQRIVLPDGQTTGVFPLFRLVSSLYPNLSDGERQRRQWNPLHVKALVNSALRGHPLPSDLLIRAALRCRAEQKVPPERAAVIKLALTWGGADMDPQRLIRLDPQEPEAAYQCGRLLAIVEEVQRAVSPGVNTTVVDRFYGAAASAPASTFGVLLRLAQARLGQLRRSKEGTYVLLSKALEEVLGRLSGFPATLSLDRQALFALGYYHQRAELRGNR